MYFDKYTTRELKKDEPYLEFKKNENYVNMAIEIFLNYTEDEDASRAGNGI